MYFVLEVFTKMQNVFFCCCWEGGSEGQDYGLMPPSSPKPLSCISEKKTKKYILLSLFL